MKIETQNTALKQAEQKVKRIKNFYNHLQIFVIMMIGLLVFSNTIISFFESVTDNPNTLKWIESNIWVNALLWFIGLAIHGLVAFRYKPNLIETWEKKKKIQNYLYQLAELL